MTDIVQTPGRAARLRDNTRDWVEAFGRKNGKLKPSLVLRFATDTSWMRNTQRHLYRSANEQQQTKAVMNIATPCQRVPGILSWQANETEAITQTASMELLNCLLISEVSTKLTGAGLEAGAHNNIVINNYVLDSMGVQQEVVGNNGTGQNYDPENQTDADGYHYHEENVQFRTFQNQTMTVADASKFPLPQIPLGDDDNDTGNSYPVDTNGVGAYFLLLGDPEGNYEIVRVNARFGNMFEIPPGGRNIGSDSEYVQAWPANTPVTMLNMGPFTGDWVGMGYLNIDDFRPEKAILRPGTCLTSYEGWGDIVGPMKHDGGPNYVFTGYWFVTGAEPSISDDGIPRIRVDLMSAGYILEKQLITPDILRRAQNQYGQWHLNGKNYPSFWAAAGASREIKGDWVDYNSWDPSDQGSYPMNIQIELSQNEDFYNHMMETDMGNQCLICREENKQWLTTHKSGGATFIKEQRAVGRHIYKESIRVLRERGGPLKTYIRLMAVLAAAAWEHPAMATPLTQKFTKMPNKLFQNIFDLDTGLVFNGQIKMELTKNDDIYDWFTPTYTDEQIVSKRVALTCPYKSTYDKQPFSQPMQDLADVNGARLWISRKGQPVFVPPNFNYRSHGKGGEWTQSYGASISQYSHSIDIDQIVTQVWVTGKSCFKSEMTVIAGGTGWNGDKRIQYSGLGGNTQGLALTSGVQHIETLSLDNTVLGLDWDTNPAGYGAHQIQNGSDTQINALPPLHDGSPAISASTAAKNKAALIRIQKTINFFMVRRYFLIASDPRTTGITVDGKWDKTTEAAIKALQTFVGVTADGVYGRTTYTAVKNYLDTHEHYIQFDIWWYVENKRPLEEYFSAITGMPIKLGDKKLDIQNTDVTQSETIYAIDDSGSQSEVGIWTKTFARSLIAAGDRMVDDSINKSIVRTIASNMADPRIQPGDTIWCEVPGFLGTRGTPPYTNGVYVTSISRTMDLQAGSYVATYSGFRYIGDHMQGLPQRDIDEGYKSVDAAS